MEPLPRDGIAARVLVSRTAPVARGAGWVVDGFRLFSRDWLAWLVVSLLLTVASLLLQAALPLLGTILVFLLSPVVVGGLMLALRDGVDGRPLLIGDLFRAFSGAATGSLLTIGLVSFLLNLVAAAVAVVVVVVFAGAGFLTSLAQSEDMLAAAMALTFSLGLLIGLLVYVALLLPVTMLVWFAPALVVLEGEQAFAAMRHSFMGCLRNMLPYLVYGLVGLLVFPLLLALTLGLGVLVLLPVGLASIHAAYRDIFLRA